MPTSYELIEMIEKEQDHDEEATIIESNELMENIKEDPEKFILKLGNELDEYAERKHRCSKCGRKLTTNTYKESREYQGFPCKESITEDFCEKCGK